MNDTRKKQKALMSWHDASVRKQLAMMAVEEDTTQQALIAEALNLLFKKRGRPQIA